MNSIKAPTDANNMHQRIHSELQQTKNQDRQDIPYKRALIHTASRQSVTGGSYCRRGAKLC